MWLPEHCEPVVCGRLDDTSVGIRFVYGQSFLSREDADAIYAPELPLVSGAQYAVSGEGLPLCIDDAMPDSWGRAVVNQYLDAVGQELDPFTYLLNSGSDRIGALDFQSSSSTYVPREHESASLEDLAEATDLIGRGEPLPKALELALVYGTAVGGARPKALVEQDGTHYIAKFSSSTDMMPMVQAEYVAMTLARQCGISVADVALVNTLNRHALLVKRFDRTLSQKRRRMISLLTILGMTTFPEGRYASYTNFAEKIRFDFATPTQTLHELFRRIAFNIMCGNTDDHGRNHAAFVQNKELVLTPAYDVAPQPKSSTLTNQAMAFGLEGQRESRLSLLVDASDLYHLENSQAQAVVDEMVDIVESNFAAVCDQAQLTNSQVKALKYTQILNPSIFE